jgi:drug/metabolite transporter (DMT)-like permease
MHQFVTFFLDFYHLQPAGRAPCHTQTFAFSPLQKAKYRLALPTHVPIMSSRPALVGILLVLASAILFATKSIFIKLAYQESVDPITLLTLRLVFALPFFMAMGLLTSHQSNAPALHRRDWAVMFLLGFAGYYLSSLLDFMGLQYISAGLERLVLFLYPTITVLMTAFVLKRPVSRMTWLAIGVSYAGMALVVWPDIHHGGEHLALGMMLVFGSALTYASYLVGSGEIIQRIGANRFTGITLSISSLCCAVHFLLANPLSQLMVSPRVLGLGIILAIVCTVMPATLLTNGIKRIGASKAALIGAVGPVATLYLGYSVLGETMVTLQIAGTALVLAGVLMVSLNK